MKNKRSLFLLLLLINWIVLLGQIPASDSIKCYTTSQLRKIAYKVISANECDTLLKVSNQQNIIKAAIIKSQDITIKSQDQIISDKDKQLFIKDHMIDEQELVITTLNDDLKKAHRKIKWIKVGWVATSIVLATTTVLALIK